MSGPHAEDGMNPTELHHLLPVAGRAEVMATVLAHGDRGDGYCNVCHELDPCGVRSYQETVLSEMNRRLR